jgi:hypothetical protein
MHRYLLILVILFSPASHAAEAVVKLVLGQATAKANTSLVAGSTFGTAAKSRSEVALKSGLFRTGSATRVQIAGEDAVQLEAGTLLVASQPGLFRRSVSVQAPGYGFQVRGTAQVFYDPGRSIRVVALEGQVVVSLASLSGEKVTLKPGQQLIISPNERALPRPIEIDLARLMATSQLLSSAFEPVVTAQRLGSATRKQEREISGESLEATPLMMEGGSGELYVVNEEIMHEEVQEEFDDLDGDGEEDDFYFDEEGNLVFLDEGEDLPEDAVLEGGEGENGDVVIAGDEEGTDDASPASDEGGDDGERHVGSSGVASSKKRSKRNVLLSGANISGNNVTIGSRKTKTSIQITNSSQVAAIAGNLSLLGHQGPVNVSASALRASGQLLIDTDSTASIQASTLAANVIKARAFSAGGNALVIDGSTLNANTLIQLYAEGAGTLLFRNQVNLNTPHAVLAGKTVEVQAGGAVNVKGKASVFTDDARFNLPGYGTLSAGGGATTQPHAARPKF